MNPPPLCVATITTRKTGLGETLPQLGGASPTWLPLLAIALLGAGAGVILLASALNLRADRSRRSRNRGTAIAAGIGGLAFLALLAGAELTAPRAEAVGVSRAQAGPERLDTSYGAGCRLFEVTGIDRNERIGRILPGDDAPILTVALTNRFAQPVTVSAAAELRPTASHLDALPVTARFAGAAEGPERLGPGEATELSVAATPPPTLGNEAQGAEYALTVIVTATGQRDVRG